MARRNVTWWMVGIGLTVAAIAAVVALIRMGQTLPDEVQPITWHKHPCAHCQMLISEPAHAAQLITTDGSVYSFDDPGCALQLLSERRPQVHRMWFHHVSTERWLTADQVAFTVGGTTPMGFGLRAVDAGTPGAIGLAEAQSRVQSRVQGGKHASENGPHHD